MSAVLLGVLAFGLMEPVAYLLHRFVMHGIGSGWHRSHHRPRATPLEANDLYPVVLAGFTIMLMAAGTFVGSLAPLVPIGAGVTGYGVGYLFVHDLYIHRRLRW